MQQWSNCHSTIIATKIRSPELAWHRTSPLLSRPKPAGPIEIPVRRISAIEILIYDPNCIFCPIGWTCSVVAITFPLQSVPGKGPGFNPQRVHKFSFDLEAQILLAGSCLQDSVGNTLIPTSSLKCPTGLLLLNLAAERPPTTQRTTPACLSVRHHGVA